MLISIISLLCVGVLSSQFTQVGSDIEGVSEDDQFGKSVSLSSDGTLIAIGAPNNDVNGSQSGQVKVYAESGSIWTQIGGDINGEAAGDASGLSVALSLDGSRLAIAAPGNDLINDGYHNNSGQVRVYHFSGGIWTQLGDEINGQAGNDNVGLGIAISGNGTRLAIGGNGFVKVYEESEGVWTQLGSSISIQGAAVSISSDGTRLAIGSPYSNNNATLDGMVRIFSETDGEWLQVGSDIIGEAAYNRAGHSVSLSANGTRIAIGAPGINPAPGHVRVFSESGGSWSQVGSDIEGESPFDGSGSSVSLSSDGTRLAIGAPSNPGNSGGTPGHVRVYSESSGVWSQITPEIDGEGYFDESGSAVSLSADGSRLAIGAPLNGTDYFIGLMGAGHVRIYDSGETVCPDADMDGYTYAGCGGTDCVDNNAYINITATEICNGVDDNCDGLIDDDDPTVAGQSTWYADNDNDGYGNPEISVNSCNQPNDYVGTGTDCNDTNGSSYPGANEIPDNSDNDCDGLIDEGLSILNVDAGDCVMVLYGYTPEACTVLIVTVTNGTMPYSYEWSNGATSPSITVCPGETTIYSITVTDATGQSAVDYVTVQVIDVTCGNNGNKILVCHTPVGNPENQQVICISPSAIADHLAHGCFVGLCNSPDPCEDENQSMIVIESENHSASIDNLHHSQVIGQRYDPTIQIMPNPANDHIMIELFDFENETLLRLIDLSGKVLKEEKMNDVVHQVNTSSLQNGIYIIQLISEDHVLMKSILIAH